MFAYPPFFHCKSTGDATREKRNKTNSCSQKVCTALYRRVLPVSCTSSVFSSVSYPPSCFVICCVYSFVTWYYFSSSNACLHTPAVVIKFRLQKRQKQSFIYIHTYIYVCIYIYIFFILVLLFWNVFDYWYDVETTCATRGHLCVLPARWERQLSVATEKSALIKVRRNAAQTRALKEVQNFCLLVREIHL